MKKALLSVLLLVVGLLAGCRSPLRVRTSEGMFVVKDPSGLPIQVSGGLQEKVDRFVPTAQGRMDDYLAKKIAAREFAATYPYPIDGDIQEFFKAEPLSGEDLDAVRFAGQQLLGTRIERKVDPAWADDVVQEAVAAAKAKLEGASAGGPDRFDEAREAAWNPKATSRSRVDAMVADKLADFVVETVNPAQWKDIEGRFNAEFDACIAEKRFADVANLLKPEYGKVRPYPRGLKTAPKPTAKDLVDKDGKLGTVALNARIDRLKGDLARKWEASFPAWADLAYAPVRASAQAKLEEGDFAGARVAALDVKPAGHPKVDELVRARAVEVVNKVVNPAHMAHIATDTAARIDALTAEKKFDEALAFARDYALGDLGSLPEHVRKDMTDKEGEIGTGRMAARFESLRADLLARIQKAKKAEFDRQQEAKLAALARQVVEDVKANRFDQARNAIRDFALVDDAEWDMNFYKARVGLLDSVVNPNQLPFLCKAAREKIVGLVEAGKVEEARRFVLEYPYVHDTFGDIMSALDGVEKAMVGLSAEEDRSAEYIRGLKARINELMEKRWGRREENYTKEDLAELEKALAAFRGGFLAQQYNVARADMITNEVANAVIQMSNRKLPPMTTWELNEELGRFMVEEMSRLNAVDEAARTALRNSVPRRPAAMRSRAGLDERTSYDAQIALAEGFIKRPGGPLGYEALVGDYARIMRRLKAGTACSRDEADTLLLGAVCLNQESVFDFALEQGASVDAVPRRISLPPLLAAIELERYGFVTRLRDAKCSLAVRDAQGRTALHYALERGNLELASSLLAEVDLMSVDNAGRTVLFTAVGRNQLAAAKWLVEQAGGNARGFVGMKARVAVGMKSGLDGLREDDRLTAFDYACCVNAHMLLDLLAETGASYDEADLALALANDCVGAAQWLVEHGLDVNHPAVWKAAAKTGGITATLRYLQAEGLSWQSAPAQPKSTP